MGKRGPQPKPAEAHKLRGTWRADRHPPTLEEALAHLGQCHNSLCDTVDRLASDFNEVIAAIEDQLERLARRDDGENPGARRNGATKEGAS